MSQQKTYLSDQELEEFRNLLIEQRQRLIESLQQLDMEVNDQGQWEKIGAGLTNMPTHPADRGTDNFEREMSMRLQASQQRELIEIDEALRKIEDKTYGICEATGEPISKERLLAKPWAKFSLEYARKNPESMQT